MKLFVTIYEESLERAMEAIRELDDDHDGVEIRAERFPSISLVALRAATTKPIILTYRTGPGLAPPAHERPSMTEVLAAGIDYVDVEWRDDVVIEVPERTVLSHHDFEGMRDVERIMREMRSRNCAWTKLAATPQCFADNERLLALLPGTVIGMGERGLYSRILAPFRGAELTFVAGTNIAAPGQLTLERAQAIFGPHRQSLRADYVFAVAGNPAGHSISPSIHNALFRDEGIAAAYSIASVDRFDEIAGPFLRGEPRGLSVTAPFKEEAFEFARRHATEMGVNAERARAVNTLVNVNGRIIADNTDVDGFEQLLPHASKAAVVGAGATARAALVALADAGIPAVVYNRTAERGDAPLHELASFDGDLVINTLPSGVDAPLPKCRTYIEAAYGGPPRDVEAQVRIGGLELLRAQAVRQHELFLLGIDDLR